MAQEESDIKDKMEEDTNCIPPVRTTVTINSKSKVHYYILYYVNVNLLEYTNTFSI